MTISGFAAYVKQLWKNKPDTSTPLSAARLLHLEDGIKGSSDAIEKIAAAVISQIINDPNKIASMAALYAVNQNLLQLNSDMGQIKFAFVYCDVPADQDWFYPNIWIPLYAQYTPVMAMIQVCVDIQLSVTQSKFSESGQLHIRFNKNTTTKTSMVIQAIYREPK